MRIVLVDDELPILSAIQYLFDWKALGYTIVGSFTNGLDALDFLQKNRVDVLVTDINMPQMTGLELIEKAKEINPYLSVIVLSSYDDFSYMKKALVLKVEDYLLKPLQENEFQHILLNIKEKCEKSSLYGSKQNNEVSVIRENLLNRLIRQRMTFLELEEKSTFININLYHTYYNLYVVKLKETNEKDSIRSYFQKQIILSNEGIEVFEDFDMNLVVLFGADTVEELNHIGNKYIEEILAGLKEIGKEYIISTGEPIQDILGCSQIYYQAQHLSSIIITNNYHLQLNESTNCGPLPSLSALVDLKSIRSHLLEDNFSAVYVFLEKIFKNMEQEEVPSFEIKNLCLRLICWIDNFYDECHIYLEESPNYYDYITLGILESICKQQLIAYLNGHLALYEERKSYYRTSYSPIILQIKKFIDTNFTNPDFNLKTISAKYHVNSSYLGQLFYKEVGTYFNDYLSKLKNEKALDLLLQSKMSNNQIAEYLGYSEVSYFYKKFKAYHGFSPQTIRQKMIY